MKIVAIYDNGGKTFDRYTVVTNVQESLNTLMMLGLSEHPTSPDGYGMWGAGRYIDGGLNGHIGKRVRFEHLTEELQQYIASRVFTEELMGEIKEAE